VSGALLPGLAAELAALDSVRQYHAAPPDPARELIVDNFAGGGGASTGIAMARTMEGERHLISGVTGRRDGHPHLPEKTPGTMDEDGSALTFAALRKANIARLPLFKGNAGQTAHTEEDGSDWVINDWIVAVLGELGELATFEKLRAALVAAHDARVGELLAANNAEVERRRAAETRMAAIAALVREMHPRIDGVARLMTLEARAEARMSHWPAEDGRAA
jgi:hypothetical protein